MLDFHEDDSGLLVRKLDDGRSITLMPLTFDRWRLGIGPSGTPFFDQVY